MIILIDRTGSLTAGQAWYLFDRLVDLCQTQPVTNCDLKTLLIDVQLEYHRQQPIYPKLLDSLQSLAACYSTSFAELRALERDLHSLLRSSSSSIKRIPDDVRRRLNEMIALCQQFYVDRSLREQLFGASMNVKFYNQLKDIFQTKHLAGRKQSLTAIVQTHKHFVQTSRSSTRRFLLSDQIDAVLQSVENQALDVKRDVRESFRRMAELGRLQVSGRMRPPGGMNE